jgi:hypothetical protein
MRRNITMSLASIASGVLATLAVAWFFALWPRAAGPYLVARPTPPSHSVECPAFELCVAPGQLQISQSRLSCNALPCTEIVLSDEVAATLLPAWSRCSSDGLAFNSPWVLRSEYAAGWPCLAVRLEQCVPNRRSEPLRDSVWTSGALILPPAWETHCRTLLPYMPIFPGFVINVAFYTICFATLVFAPPCAIRRWRTRHSLCAVCGYPIGTSQACCECGTPAV